MEDRLRAENQYLGFVRFGTKVVFRPYHHDPHDPRPRRRRIAEHEAAIDRAMRPSRKSDSIPSEDEIAQAVLAFIRDADGEY